MEESTGERVEVDNEIVRNEIDARTVSNVVQAGRIDTVLIQRSERPSLRRRLLTWAGLTIVIGCVTVALAPLVKQSWSNEAALDSPPPASSGGGGPPVPSARSGSTDPAMNDPCLVVMTDPDLVIAALGHGFLPFARSGPDRQLPEGVNSYADGTCLVPLADSAGELHIRLVDLPDQTSTRKVFDLLGQWESNGKTPARNVSGLFDDARQAPGWFIVRRANRVVAIWFKPSDVGPSQPVSLEALGRYAASRAWSS